MELTKKGIDYLYGSYGIEEDALGNVFPDLPCDLVVKALNYAGECDEAYPDQDFIKGALWAMDTDFEPMSTTQSVQESQSK